MITNIISSAIIALSFSARSANIDTTYDYELALSYLTKSIYMEVERERENGAYYNNFELGLKKEYKYVQLNFKRLYIESRSTNIYQVDGRIIGKGYTIGAAQIWDCRDMKFNMVLGLHNKNLKAEILTTDFNKYMYTAELKFKTDYDKFNYFVSGKVKDYGDPDWSIKTGVEVGL